MADLDEYEFSPDEPTTTVKPNEPTVPVAPVIKKRQLSQPTPIDTLPDLNIDSDVANLVLSVDQFNKLPDSKKIGKPFDDIMRQKKKCEKTLDELRKQMDDPVLNPVIVTDNILETYMKRISEIENTDITKLTLKQKITIYTELAAVRDGLSKFFASKRLEIKEV